MYGLLYSNFKRPFTLVNPIVRIRGRYSIEVRGLIVRVQKRASGRSKLGRHPPSANEILRRQTPSFRLLYNQGKSLQIIKNLLLVLDTIQRINEYINAQRCRKFGTPNASRGRKTTICCGRPPGDQLSSSSTTGKWCT